MATEGHCLDKALLEFMEMIEMGVFPEAVSVQLGDVAMSSLVLFPV